MTHMRRTSIISHFALAAVATLVASGTALRAQAGPPIPRPSTDSQPALRVPIPPSAPPSSVAPRNAARAIVREAEPAAPLLLVVPVGPPVDSVRPAPVVAAQVVPLQVGSPPPVPQAAPVARRLDAQALIQSDAVLIDATARCKDGTFLFGALPAEPCAERGGLVALIPVKPAPPRPPRPD